MGDFTREGQAAVEDHAVRRLIAAVLLVEAVFLLASWIWL